MSEVLLGFGRARRHTVERRLRLTDLVIGDGGAGEGMCGWLAICLASTSRYTSAARPPDLSFFSPAHSKA